MATSKRTLLALPDLNSNAGSAYLTLTTDKSSSGGLYCVAAIEFHGAGFVRFEMFGDFRKTVAQDRKLRGTQKAIDTLHASTFTPEAIESLKTLARAFYATKRAKEAEDNKRMTASMLRTAELSRSTPYGPGHALSELTDSGMDASTALRMLNID